MKGQVEEQKRIFDNCFISVNGPMNLLKVDGDLAAFESEKDLIPKMGYVVNGEVFQYVPHAKNEGPVAIVTFTEDGELKFMPSVFRMRYMEKDIFANTPAHIKEKSTADMTLVGNSQILDATSPASCKPEIHDDDDFLKRIIKTVLGVKNVDTARFKKLFEKKWGFQNLIQTLNGKTCVTVRTWDNWVRVLGIDIMIIVKDNHKDPSAPLKKYVTFQSDLDYVDTSETKEDLIRSVEEFIS